MMSLQKVLLPDLQLHTEGKMSLFSPPWDIILMEIGYNLPLSRPKRTFCSDIKDLFLVIKGKTEVFPFNNKDWKKSNPIHNYKLKIHNFKLREALMEV